MAKYIEPMYVRGPKDKNGKSLFVSVRPHSFSVRRPNVSTTGQAAGVKVPLYPGMCRRTGATYRGDLMAGFTVVLDNKDTFEVPVSRIARIPVMVGSEACHLQGKKRDQLVKLGEEEYEVGGTFIVNGTEKLIRLVVTPRVNHPISAQRAKNKDRGHMFSELALSYRSMRPDLSTFTVHLHFLRTGEVRLRLSLDRNEYLIPIGVLMRALLQDGTTDRDIFRLIVGGEDDNMPLVNSAMAICAELAEGSVYFKEKDKRPGEIRAMSRSAATAYLGRMFRAVIGMDDEAITDYDAGVAFLRRYIFVHLSTSPYEEEDESLHHSKVDLMVMLVRKLVATSTGEVEVDNADAISHQGIMAPGHLFLILLKERISIFLRTVASLIRRGAEKDTAVMMASGKGLKGLILDSFKKSLAGDSISRNMSYLLATGTVSQGTPLDLPQTVGYSIMAERINYLRFLSHFRAVHRGAFYAAMRSTKVRKLLPEAWGFICPVHTPDGDPCGILNHLTSTAVVTHGSPADRNDVLRLFSDFNITPAPALSPLTRNSPKGSLPVVVDGRVLGFVREDNAQTLADQLRFTKSRDEVSLLDTKTEVVYCPLIRMKTGFQPGIFVYTGGCRVMRPVIWLRDKLQDVEELEQGGVRDWIGSMEQVFLRVRSAVADQKGSLNKVETEGATHAEISSTAFLSVLASMSPFADMNQGPRNMFQCQMAKQTIGTPCHTIWSRMESKVYRHTTPQVPIVRNSCMQDPWGDLFPNGVNAVVAVISYTGNDMEDALIINKGSIDRGFAHAFIYMNDRVDLDDTIEGREKMFTALTEEESESVETTDIDGLPAVGSRVQRGSKLYGVRPRFSKGGLACRETKWTKYKYEEQGTVDEVSIYDGEMYKGAKGSKGIGTRQANVRVRVSRKPSVGDKFASRAGQKGTMSGAWATEDMPFSESGMTPDILFNPNGFPSRMTIGMMIEIMAGKVGAMNGTFQDSTPFQFDEDCRAVDYFGELLTKAGFEACGTETLYSGYTGEPFEVNIFTGIVHYQRLRHMVSDKFQVRTTGPINPLVRQPIKGRKRGGAIRFGEMERDGLLAHGASFLLRDRLSMGSDNHVVYVCGSCGGVVTGIRKPGKGVKDEGKIICRNCEEKLGEGGYEMRKVTMPYSFKYLANELAAMNIRTVLKTEEAV